MTVSRYQSVGTATIISAGGHQIPYLRRRFLAPVDAPPRHAYTWSAPANWVAPTSSPPPN